MSNLQHRERRRKTHSRNTVTALFRRPEVRRNFADLSGGVRDGGRGWASTDRGTGLSRFLGPTRRSVLMAGAVPRFNWSLRHLLGRFAPLASVAALISQPSSCPRVVFVAPHGNAVIRTSNIPACDFERRN
jgi:hypothetical protein